MGEPLLSPDWYRIAHMRPRLRAGVRVSRQQVRGETWFVLSDPVSGRHHRFNDIAYGLIGRCDGQASLDEIWANRVDAEGDNAPSQAETIRVFVQAFGANLFVGDVTPDAAAIVRAHGKLEDKRRRAALNPLSFKVPLWDPDAFLSEHVHRVAWLFSRPAAIVGGLLITLGALLLALNAEAVSAFAQRELGSGRMLLMMWLAYPVCKALHELAHAFAVKVYGGDVHEIGASLLLLTPLPYVDASASVAFSDKRRRVVVAAAGIVVEALLASIALVLWLLLEPGLARDLAFAVVVVGALSTIVVNGNPLLRFDGYHVLCDALELPNLAQRSLQYWHYLLKRRLLGLRHVYFGSRAAGERPWLIAYAPLSWAYRSALLVLLALMVANWNGTLGLFALACAAWLVLGKPAWSTLRWVSQSAELNGARGRAALLTGVSALVLGGLAFGVPLPQRSHAPGVVWLPDDAQLRLASDGFVESFRVEDGDAVQAGSLIAVLHNPILHAELAQVEAELRRRQVERALRFENDAQGALAAEDEIAKLNAQRDRLVQRIDGLAVRAGVAGRVVIDPRHVVVGQYVRQGELLGHVLPGAPPLVRALVRNEDIALVRERPGRISVAFAQADLAPAHATLDGAVPQATTHLPTPALGDLAGGSAALDSSDVSGKTARAPHFQFDLRLTADTPAHIGTRVLVTFLHGEASAAELVARFVRQSFLRFFER